MNVVGAETGPGPLAHYSAAEETPALASKDAYLLDRASMLTILDLIHTAVPGVAVELHPEPIIRVAVSVAKRPTSPEAGQRGRSALEIAEHIYRSRRQRDQALGSDLFADPAWDLILDLFIATKRGRRVCVSSACIAAAAPATTALRWLKELERKGIVVRTPDELDARRIFVELGADFAARVEALLEAFG